MSGQQGMGGQMQPAAGGKGGPMKGVGGPMPFGPGPIPFGPGPFNQIQTTQQMPQPLPVARPMPTHFNQTMSLAPPSLRKPVPMGGLLMSNLYGKFGG